MREAAARIARTTRRRGNALYQLTDYPEQAVASPDGVDRIEPFDLPMVQSATQAQRLAKLHLMRKQFQGTYDPTLGPRAWRSNIGRNVTFTHPVLPWVEKIFRTAQLSVSKAGPTKTTLIEEDSSIYAWNPATDEKAPITAGAPTVFNPDNNPLVAPDLQTALRDTYPVFGALRITASETGGVASIIIPDFTMDYSGGSQVPIAGTTIGGLVPATAYYPYVDVVGLDDAAPTFGVVTVYADALNSTDHPNRVYLNQDVTTPASGSGGTTSGGGFGGGYGGGGAIP